MRIARQTLFPIVIVGSALCSSALASDSQANLFEMSLEELLTMQVVTATGQAQTIKNAPAVISVITKNDIANWGVTSVGEALNKVPGVYCINDLLSFNCGIRGINGGFRGNSKVMKVMINGQSVSFRSDTNNYLGAELIPMNLIERIEIVRGPVSALYGANAFLGVVNIITLTADDEFAMSFEGSASHLKEGVGHHVSLALSGKLHDWQYVVGVHTGKTDRSGLAVPNTIPALSPLNVGQMSENDHSKPTSFYADIGKQWQNIFQDGDGFNIAISAWYSHLNSDAQWQDFGFFNQSGELGLSQHIDIKNQFVKVKTGYDFSDTLSFELSVAWSQGEPGGDKLIDVGAPSFIPLRQFGYDAVDYQFEVNWALDEGRTLIVGLDNQNDDEELFKAYRVDRESGIATLATEDLGFKRFEDNGVYIQYTDYLTDAFGITVNGRFDNHNIYGGESTYRLGLVYNWNKALTTKLLVGSSYKAPAAIQLFAQPLFSGEVQGNADLLPEKAKTFELQIDWLLTEETNVALNIFSTRVKDKVEVLGTNAFNVGLQSTLGVEGVLKWVRDDLSLSANFSWQETDAETNNVIGEIVSFPSSMYPKLMSNIVVGYRLNNKTNINLSYYYVSPRRASETNILLNGNAAYQLDEFSLVNLVAIYQASQNTSLYFNVDNLLDEEYQSVGFNGVDIPGLPRMLFMGFRYNY